jgi:hypothetical protein
MDGPIDDNRDDRMAEDFTPGGERLVRRHDQLASWVPKAVRMRSQ